MAPIGPCPQMYWNDLHFAQTGKTCFLRPVHSDHYRFHHESEPLACPQCNALRKKYVSHVEREPRPVQVSAIKY